MFKTLASYLRLVLAYISLNFNSQIAYKGAFVLQVLAMAFNNSIWLIFWSVFFTRFPVLGGWNVKDVITIWAIAASGFGIHNAFFGNALIISSLIVQGQIDVWMLYPRAVLPHLLLGRMGTTAWGDMIFGYGVYLAFIKPDFKHFLLFLFLSISVSILFIGFNILTGSLSFFLGNATGLGEQWQFAMITFSTYPSVIFDGFVKLILYTFIPAVFITYFPIQALREFSLVDALVTFLGAIAVLMIGVGFFYLGLRRYESGNLMEMRG